MKRDRQKRYTEHNTERGGDIKRSIHTTIHTQKLSTHAETQKYTRVIRTLRSTRTYIIQGVETSKPGTPFMGGGSWSRRFSSTGAIAFSKFINPGPMDRLSAKTWLYVPHGTPSATFAWRRPITSNQARERADFCACISYRHSEAQTWYGHPETHTDYLVTHKHANKYGHPKTWTRALYDTDTRKHTYIIRVWRHRNTPIYNTKRQKQKHTKWIKTHWYQT